MCQTRSFILACAFVLWSSLLTAAEWPSALPLRRAFQDALPIRTSDPRPPGFDASTQPDAADTSLEDQLDTVTDRTSEFSSLESRSARKTAKDPSDETPQTVHGPPDSSLESDGLREWSLNSTDDSVIESSLADVDALFQPQMRWESEAADHELNDDSGESTSPDILNAAVFDESELPASVLEAGHVRERINMRRAARTGYACPPSSEPCGPLERLFPAAYIPPCSDYGIGHERVMYAPFFINSAKPFTHIALQYDQGWGISKPDRSEYFWAAPPKGRGVESSVDVMTLRARMETATDRASAIIEVPMRSINPEINKNTVGIGDLVTGGKVVIVDGRDWVVTQQTLTYVNTGPAGRGLGSGHVSIEPGLLVRYRWSDETYIHSQLRYVIPISGTANYAGEVLIWGIGLSKIWYENDAFAVLPTFEIVGTSFLDGQRTTATGGTADVDGETAIEFLPGLRFVLGPEGDLGLPELGISGGVTAGDAGWYTGRILLEARWNF
ncbi:MAG: hypothetical protein KDA86_03605 [Planctomycetaceae bacterium]|nr:hypothetical protein [Planctomycetaceae bacterium]